MKEKNRVFGKLVIILLACFMFWSVMHLPPFGVFSEKGVAMYYIQNGLEKTGSANIVNSIVWDFRGYDTLGEETVLFTATIGVILIIRRKLNGRNR
ncbi:MAG: hypothetical protein DRP13_03520 [Candidatus Aenigmatarchaeota archaeon]|nr:MAG: hypothetical protein DRP18_00060 [Candidatus Aenigmarchaeota archaeon]RLJ07356.1 MAG: hypothetical protein DRP16_03615 [Candidatus Aenigmarchaeota archaeon]RLJ07667.1 MAG: hypothetical protein DRP13_03520 [Candidatus Aenigmarchaeota archaeon]